MGSHTSDYGEPRTVAGYEVSFAVTTFSRSVARSLDVYAKEGDEEVLLTTESLDDEPSDADIITMLDWACEEGKLSCQWRVDYMITPAGSHDYVTSSSCVVTARNAKTAKAAALTWVHDHDPHCDPRIDPVVELWDWNRIPVGEDPSDDSDSGSLAKEDRRNAAWITDVVTDDDEDDEEETVECYKPGLRRVLDWIRQAQAVPGVPAMTAEQQNDLAGLEADASS